MQELFDQHRETQWLEFELRKRRDNPDLIICFRDIAPLSKALRDSKFAVTTAYTATSVLPKFSLLADVGRENSVIFAPEDYVEAMGMVVYSMGRRNPWDADLFAEFRAAYDPSRLFSIIFTY